jgi:hypothetical protein
MRRSRNPEQCKASLPVTGSITDSLKTQILGDSTQSAPAKTTAAYVRTELKTYLLLLTSIVPYSRKWPGVMPTKALLESSLLLSWLMDFHSEALHVVFDSSFVVTKACG